MPARDGRGFFGLTDLRDRITETLRNTAVDPWSAAAGAQARLVEMDLIRELDIAKGEVGW